MPLTHNGNNSVAWIPPSVYFTCFISYPPSDITIIFLETKMTCLFVNFLPVKEKHIFNYLTVQVSDTIAIITIGLVELITRENISVNKK